MDNAIDGIGREAIQSSNLAAIGYDPARSILAVEFKSGDVVHYAGVSADFAVEFYASESKGKFYHQRIRGKFQAAMMTGPCNNCALIGPLGRKCETCFKGVYAEKARRRDESERKYV